jgi:POT family proton-dependent oligopeptide transporter
MLGMAAVASWWPEDARLRHHRCLALGAILLFGGVGTSMQLERARGAHPDEAVDGVRAVLRILIVFAIVSPFWSLFDQKASTWVLQGKRHDRSRTTYGGGPAG